LRGWTIDSRLGPVFIGHFAVAFAAKRVAPAVSLGTLMLAAQLADLLWPTLLLLGIEQVRISPGDTATTPLEFLHYPYSHSFLALFLWALGLAGLYALRHGRSLAASAVLVALVLSHWVLDVITHRPDMPITIGGATRVGFGLWNSVAADLLVELAMLGVGVALYVRATRPVDRVGRLALTALVGLLCVVFIANVFGPPPPSATAVAWAAQAIWLLVAWGYWIDRHRRAR